MHDIDVPLRRLHIWSRVGFAHLRAHRCGVIEYPERDDRTAFCPRPPIYRADLHTATVFGDHPVTALCATHGLEARHWDTVTRLTTFRELDHGWEG